MKNIDPLDRENVIESVNFLRNFYYGRALDKGKWPNLESEEIVRMNDRLRLRRLRNAANDLSRALDSLRDLNDGMPTTDEITRHLADTMTNILDLSGEMNLDLAEAMAEKLGYNASRQDHKPENRRAVGGKSY